MEKKIKEKIIEYFASPTRQKTIVIVIVSAFFGLFVLDKWFTMTREMIFWTCSTIVQAFAALLAFVGMFYIFQKEASMREILYSAEAHNAFISNIPRAARYDRYVIYVGNLTDIEELKKENKKLENLSNKLEEDEGLGLLTHKKVFDYRQLIKKINFENKIMRYESIKQNVAPSLELMLLVLLFSLIILPFGSMSVKDSVYLKYLFTSSTAWVCISIIIGVSIWAVYHMVIAIRDLAFR